MVFYFLHDAAHLNSMHIKIYEKHKKYLIVLTLI